MLFLIFFVSFLIAALVVSFYLLIPVLQVINAAIFNAAYDLMGVANSTISNIPDENVRNSLTTGITGVRDTFVTQYNLMNALISHAWLLILIILIVSSFIIARWISQQQEGGRIV
jgi:lysylphosphatidylglycerol synthetase-like protein (DUF2156 family)